MKKLLLFLLVVCVNVHANPWKECGIGAIVSNEFDFESKWMPIITNVTWDYGSTAISSAVTTPDSCAGKEVSAAKFINATYTTLEEETIKGSGEHVDTMLTILGCESDKDAITASVRSTLSSDINSADYAEMTTTQKAESYYNIVDSAITGEFSESCTI